MTPTLIFSALDALLADALARRVHFPSAELVPGAICCRICAVLWSTGAAWAADSGVCPGAEVGR